MTEIRIITSCSGILFLVNRYTGVLSAVILFIKISLHCSSTVPGIKVPSKTIMCEHLLLLFEYIKNKHTKVCFIYHVCSILLIL